MAKVSKKQLRRLNHRAGGSVVPSILTMTKMMLKPQGGSPKESGQDLRSREAPDRHQKVTRSWINANVLRSWDREM